MENYEINILYCTVIIKSKEILSPLRSEKSVDDESTFKEIGHRAESTPAV